MSTEIGKILFFSWKCGMVHQKIWNQKSTKTTNGLLSMNYQIPSFHMFTVDSSHSSMEKPIISMMENENSNTKPILSGWAFYFKKYRYTFGMLYRKSTPKSEKPIYKKNDALS